METFSMSQKEINQVKVFEELNNRTMKQKHASLMLRLSTRQIRRKLKTYRQEGTSSLIHKLRGKSSNRQLPEGLKDKAVELIEKKYPDFGPTLAAEKLEEYDGLVINAETLRLVMITAHIWQSRKRKARHRQWRPRKACLGEMIQFDGSDHDWFEGRAPRCVLLAFIDDATSRVMQAEFTKAEATLTVMKATQAYLRLYGRPIEIYADRGKVVKVNQNNPDDEFKTQYTRAMEDELGIKISFALTPQAKGRIERLFGTFQDRLIKEMRLKNISSIGEANQFLEAYLPIHNARFSLAPREKTDLHRSTKGYQLDKILCIKSQRILKNDFTLRYQNVWYQLPRKQPTLIFPKNPITISEHIDGSLSLSIRKTRLSHIRLDKRLEAKTRLTLPAQIERQPADKNVQTGQWKPAVDHPWRSFQINPQKA